jgi:hypothetical protein
MFTVAVATGVNVSQVAKLGWVVQRTKEQEAKKKSRGLFSRLFDKIPRTKKKRPLIVLSFVTVK